MRVVGLVAVRMKSSRLKGKALLDLNGKPLILQLLLRLKNSKKMDDIVLCTSTNPEDSVLLEIARKNCFKSFAGDEDDVMDRFIRAGEREKADVIVRITGDNPLTDAWVIDAMIESHVATGADYTRMNKLPVGITSEIISFSALKKAFKLAEDTRQSEYMTNYFLDYPDVFKLNLMEPEKDLVRPHYRLTVDYPEDYEVMKIIFNNFKQIHTTPIKDIITFLDENPRVVKKNSNISQKQPSLAINTRLKMKK